MPQFVFRATDQAGNTVEGNLDAENMMQASEQIAGMGYTPQAVQATEAAAPVVATATPLANPESPMQVASMGRAPLVPLGEETVNTAPERLEPWQRGGPVPQPVAPPSATRLTPSGTVITAPQTTPTAVGQTQKPPSVYTPPTGQTTGREGVSIPYQEGKQPPKTVGQRAQEQFVYPIASGAALKDLSAYYRQFATLIGAGLPLYQALAALEDNTSNGKLKAFTRVAQQQVQAGGRLSDVMLAHPWLFPPMHQELIRASELGGFLDQVLIQIADYVDHEIGIKRTIFGELLYPIIVLFVALMLLGRTFLTQGDPAFALWVLGEMGKNTYTTLNYLSDTLGFGLMMLAPVLAVVALFRLFLFNIPGVREGYDTFKLGIPILGNIVRMFVVAKFLRTFAALYRAGFYLTSSLEIAGRSCGNSVIQRAAGQCIAHLERGGLISDVLRNSGVLPQMALDMFRTGELTGNLDELLEKAANFYEGEAKTKSHQAALIFSVIVLLLVALMVLAALLKFYSGFGAASTSVE